MWGTFSTLTLCIARLPLGPQAQAVGQQREKRRRPTKPSRRRRHLPCIGLAPSAGVCGACTDAANELMRAEDIGP